MKVKKIPMRTCIVTRESLPKYELIRIVRTPEGKVEIDLKGKVNGKGTYLKKDVDVINMAKKRKAIEHFLEVEVPSNIYEELISLCQMKN